MSRWGQFHYRNEEIPVDPFEAAVFLDRARLHIKNTENPESWDLSMQARKILTEAHNRINDEMFAHIRRVNHGV